MTYALWRLLLISVAAAGGETLAYQLEWYNEVMWVGILFGVAAYILTQDVDRPRPPTRRRGEIKYWRGRPVDDDDDRPRRLN